VGGSDEVQLLTPVICDMERKPPFQHVCAFGSRGGREVSQVGLTPTDKRHSDMLYS
jgi:hypothetical protein